MKAVNIWFRLHLGKLTGLLLFLLTLFLYRSYESREVLGRWSYPFFGFIIAATILFLVAFALVLRSIKRSGRTRSHCRPALVTLDMGMLFWGVSYFLNALHEPAQAGRITDLVLFGSIIPVPVILEWISMAFLLLFLLSLAFLRRKVKWAVTFMVTGSTVLVLVLLGEGVVRIKGVLAPETQSLPTYTSALWRNRYVHLNSEGFRDAEHPLHKEAGTRRLLVVGDSFAFGSGVKNVDDRFGEQLSKRLASETRVRWEAMNAGLEDTHTLDHIKLGDRNHKTVYQTFRIILDWI